MSRRSEPLLVALTILLAALNLGLLTLLALPQEILSASDHSPSIAVAPVTPIKRVVAPLRANIPTPVNWVPPRPSPALLPAATARALPTATLTPVPLVPIVGRSVPTLLPTRSEAPPAAQASSTLIPILMYHYIREVDQNADPLGYDLSVTPDLFRAQMQWLSVQGYTTLRMAEVAQCLRGEAPCPAHAVALTFDDGYADASTAALPVLQAYGFTATFYIVSGFVGQPGYMSWDDLAVLRDAGMEIGAHSVDHLNLTALDQAEATRQIAQSRTDLERELEIRVTSFCYPAGQIDATVEQLVAEAGYQTATTTRDDADMGDALALPRRRIFGGMALESFAALFGGS